LIPPRTFLKRKVLGTPKKLDKSVLWILSSIRASFLKIVKKLFLKSFLTGVWGSAPTV
jgi:hypothetical protein